MTGELFRTFTVVMGRPHMHEFWDALLRGAATNTLDSHERALMRKLNKTMRLLAGDPRHPGLRSHEIEALSRRAGERVFESYLENNTSAAGRLFWKFGPRRGEITVIGLEPHPGSGKRAYGRVLLSLLPPVR